MLSSPAWIVTAILGGTDKMSPSSQKVCLDSSVSQDFLSQYEPLQENNPKSTIGQGFIACLFNQSTIAI